MVREMRGVFTCLSMPVKFVCAAELSALHSSQETAKLETQVLYLRQKLIGQHLVDSDRRFQSECQCLDNLW